MKAKEKQAPKLVACPYCKGQAEPITKGDLSRPLKQGRTRFSCNAGHYFTYPAPVGLEKPSVLAW